MRFAVVGATGNIGSRVCRRLLNEGHQVRALSRGGPALDALVTLGAEPFIGSFDRGKHGMEAFFAEADAAFTMVKTDWENFDDHYRSTAERQVAALRDSAVQVVVNLSAIGGDVRGPFGHHHNFYELEQAFNQLIGVRLVHLRGGWFMENFLAWVPAVLQYQKISAFFPRDLVIPCVATADVADIAADYLLRWPETARTIREVGAEDLTMPEVARIISSEIGSPADYEDVAMTDPQIKAAFTARFGTEAAWEHDLATQRGWNERLVGFRTNREPLPTRFDQFVRQSWLPAYEAAEVRPDAEDFYTWLAGR